MPGRLAGQVALVTGGSSGIGRATALRFANEGSRVVIAARRVPESEETVRMIKDEGGDALFVKTDISQTEDVEALIARTVQYYGRIDCAFNNAGITGGRRLAIAEFPEEIFDRLMATNVKGTWLCMKYELRHMSLQGGGTIVNCSSVFGLRGGTIPGVAYITSKHAVIGMTRAAALEYANKGIRVNAVCPGVFLTGATIFDEMEAAERAAHAKRVHPIGRFGAMGEIADAVVWLCSDGASFVTGHAMVVDGGRTARW